MLRVKSSGKVIARRGGGLANNTNHRHHRPRETSTPLPGHSTLIVSDFSTRDSPLATLVSRIRFRLQGFVPSVRDT